jgi:hypothetical protein
MNEDASSFAILEPQNNIGYGREGLPCGRDGQIRDLILDVTANNSFEQVAQRLPQSADRVLSAFAERAASLAVRQQDERELRAGLYAAALALALTTDAREVLPSVALLYRAATMIGRDPDREFAAVSDWIGDHAPGLIEFTRRAPADRTIEAMGFEEGVDENGFRFLCPW